jgi:hypothetical protein
LADDDDFVNCAERDLSFACLKASTARTGFQRYWMADAGCDLTVKCDDGEFHCHRVVFGSICDAWSAMLAPHTVESQTGVTTFHGAQLDVLEPILRYFYGFDLTLSLTSMPYLDRFFTFVEMYGLDAIADAALEMIKLWCEDDCTVSPHAVMKLAASVRKALQSDGVDGFSNLTCFAQSAFDADWIAKCSAKQIELLLDFKCQELVYAYEGFLLIKHWVDSDCDRRKLASALFRKLHPENWGNMHVANALADPVVADCAVSAADIKFWLQHAAHALL